MAAPGSAWVIDGDGHVMEPRDLWTRRMDPARWGDWIPRTETVEPYYDVMYAGGEVRSGGKPKGSCAHNCNVTGRHRRKPLLTLMPIGRPSGVSLIR